MTSDSGQLYRKNPGQKSLTLPDERRYSASTQNTTLLSIPSKPDKENNLIPVCPIRDPSPVRMGVGRACGGGRQCNITTLTD